MVMRINRRELMATTLVGAGGLMLVRPGLAADEPKAAAPAAPASPVNPYEIVPLGKTGIKVSRIGIGTGMRGSRRESDHTRLGEEKFAALLKDFYDRGGRMFDMADLYGSMPFVGRAMKANRDKCVFLSKMWVGGGGIPEPERPDADVVVDRFRKELQTDYIDVILMHCQTDAAWNEKWKKQMDILETLKSKKIIRAHGVSVHSMAALKTAAKEPWVDSINVRINHAGQNMDGKPEDVAPILKEMHDAGKGIVGMKLIGEGKWRDDPENRAKAAQYVVKLGTVDTMVVGFLKAAEIDDFEKLVVAAIKDKAAATATA
jgi:predicted aldo/keto reductase-like oxidoreductase